MPKDKKKSKKKAKNALTEKLLEEQDINTHDLGFDKGEVQRSRCRDPIGAGIFILHLLILAIIGGLYSGPAIKAAEHDKNAPDYMQYVEAALTLSFLSVIVATVMMRLMLYFGSQLIRVLFLLTFVLGISMTALQSTNLFLMIVGIFLIIGVVVYGRMVWKRIPVATANLVASLDCVKRNFGIVYLAYFFVLAATLLTIVWLFALIGAADATAICDKTGKDCTVDILIYIPFIISYIWIFQVVVNLVTCTAANVVRTWWFEPEAASGCISSAVKDSARQATRQKLGSVCWGALFTPYVQTINEIMNPNGDMESGIAQCCKPGCARIFDKAVSYFSQWGIIYVGLFGYSFGEASQRANAMFKAQGWYPIITDHLLRNVFVMADISLGLLMGGIGGSLTSFTSILDSLGKNAEIVGAVIGFVIGLTVGAIMLASITGSVQAVVVLFAEARDELEETHPTIHIKLRKAYKKAYPDLIRIPAENLA